jgi:hypothetical protein
MPNQDPKHLRLTTGLRCSHYASLFSKVSDALLSNCGLSNWRYSFSRAASNPVNIKSWFASELVVGPLLEAGDGVTMSCSRVR